MFTLTKITIKTLFIVSVLILMLFPNVSGSNILKYGDGVKIKTIDGRSYEGELVKRDISVFVLYTEYEKHEIQINTVTNVYKVEQLTRSCLIFGSIIGAGAGLAVGLSYEDNKRNNTPKILKAFYMAVGVGLVGGGVGALIGSNFKYEQEVNFSNSMDQFDSMVYPKENQNTFKFTYSYKF